MKSMSVDVTVVFHVISLVWALAWGCQAQYTEDTCNWSLWGEGEGPGGIRTVRPECEEGLIQWKHPYGAFRLVFTEPYAKSFETCFIAWTVNVTIKISEETSHKLKPLTLLDKKSADSEREICLRSEGGDAIVIFIEAVLDTMSGVGTFQLNYDTRLNGREISSGKSLKDCRPCSHEEIVEAVCYCDFVVRGGIETVEHHADRGESHIYVSLDKVYRQVHALFKRSNIEITTDNKTEDQNSNLIRDTGPRKHKGNIIVPHECGTAPGQGVFVFIGKVRLKRAHLLCAPRVEDFQKIWTTALRTGRNSCVIG